MNKSNAITKHFNIKKGIPASIDKMYDKQNYTLKMRRYNFWVHS